MATMSQRPSEPFQSLRGNLNLMIFVIRTWSTSLEVFFRRDFGDRYLGVQAMAVLILVPLYSLGWQDYDLRPLYWFIPAYLLRCLYVRQRAIWTRQPGDWCHSYYDGWPTGLKSTAKISERTFKRFFEPASALALGFMVRNFLGEGPLGCYLMIGGACMFWSGHLTQMAYRTRLKNIQDAMIEQQLLAEEFRQIRGSL